MWIKTCDGEYINSEWINTIRTLGGSDTQLLVGGMDRMVIVSRTEDVRDMIVGGILGDLDTMDFSGGL